jgi:hypothetical protein
MTRARASVGGANPFHGRLSTRPGEEKACPPALWRVNRNSCQFKNSRISLRNKGITFF